MSGNDAEWNCSTDSDSQFCETWETDHNDWRDIATSQDSKNGGWGSPAPSSASTARKQLTQLTEDMTELRRSINADKSASQRPAQKTQRSGVHSIAAASARAADTAQEASKRALEQANADAEAAKLATAKAAASLKRAQEQQEADVKPRTPNAWAKGPPLVWGASKTASGSGWKVPKSGPKSNWGMTI